MTRRKPQTAAMLRKRIHRTNEIRDNKGMGYGEMNDKSAALLSVLSKLLPDDRSLAKENKIQAVLHTKAYQAAARLPGIQHEFQSAFSEAALRKCTEAELENRQKCLTEISVCMQAINQMITSGGGPYITSADRPDFRDIVSMRRLVTKANQLPRQKNYSNIPSDKPMEIFDQGIIRTAKDFFYNLPQDTPDFQKALSAYLGDKKYCISSLEIDELEHQYAEQVKKCTDALDQAASAQSHWRLIKVVICITLVFLPALLAGVVGMDWPGGIAIFTAFELLLALLLWFWG